MDANPPSIEITHESWPVVVARFHSAPTDAEHEAFLDHFTQLHRSGDIYASVLVTMPDMPMTQPRHVRSTADWIRREADSISKICAGTAFVLPSPVARGVLRAVLYLQTLPNEHRVFKAEADAIDWGYERVQALQSQASGA